MIRLVWAVMTFLLLSACGQSSSPTTPADPPAVRTASTPAVAAPAPVAPPAPVALSDKDLGRICRAAIGAVNGRDPAIIKLDRVEDGMAYVSYARPDDGKVWKNRCRADGQRIIWAGIDIYGPGGGPGRWREAAEDEVMTFAVAGPSVTITTRYSDGSGEAKTYQIAAR